MPTHGSLTKAGKVRRETPKIPKTNLSKSPFPRKRNRRNYIRRILHGEEETKLDLRRLLRR